MSTDSKKQSPSPRALIAGALGLALAIVAIYFPALNGEFVYDDLLVIQQNPQISGLANIPQIFASSYWDFLDGQGNSHVGYYRPLSMVLLSIGFHLGDGAPMAFHVLSILTYVLACLAAWRFAVRLLGSEAIGFFTALLFAMHPLHVESVAWISALHDPLYALFGFLALSAFLRWREAESGGSAWKVTLWFMLSLLSKDAAVAFVPVALVLEMCRKDDKRATGVASLVRALAPFLLAFGAYYIMRAFVFGDILAGFDRTTTDFGVGAGRLALLRVELLGGAMWLLLWPAELNLFRPFQPELPEGSNSLLIGLVGSIALLSAIAIAWMRRWKPALTLLLLIPAALFPVILRVESLGTFPLSDRFLFVPVIGLAGLLAYVIWTELPRIAASGLLVVIAGALGARTLAQLPSWANEEAMFRTAVAQNPRNPNVHWGLGRVMLNRYSKTGLSDHLLEAKTSFETSMDLLVEAGATGKDIYATHDDHLQTNLGLGHALLREAEIDPFHDYELVRTIFEEVIKYQPTSERGYIGLGATWIAAGDPNQASEALRRAIQLNPNSPEAHFNMGVLLMRIQEWTGAAQEFERCLELRNNNRKDLVYLARSLVESGATARAKVIASRAHELFPEDPDPMALLGNLAALGSNQTGALEWYDRALAIAPTYGAVHLHRGMVLAQMERKSEAVKALMRACELLPQNFEAHFNLMVLLLASDKPESAIPSFLVSYKHRPANFNIRMKKAAEAIHRDDLAILTLLATIDADREDLPTAVAWASHAVELAPRHGPSNYMLGALIKKLETAQKALPYFKIAAEELPDSYRAQMDYAEALLQGRRFKQAEPFLLRALELLPGEEMDPKLKQTTEETIRTALVNLRQAQQAGPQLPDSEGQ